MSSSQLTNSYFSEGWLNHQPVMVNIYILYIYIYLDIFTIDHSYPSELNGPRKNPTMMPLLVPVVHACTAGRCHVALRGVGGHRWAPVCMFGRGGGSEMQQYFTICHIL